MEENVTDIFRKKKISEFLHDQELSNPPFDVDLKDFTRTDQLEVIAETIVSLKYGRTPLFLSSDTGQNFGKTELKEFASSFLLIDKPLNFSVVPNTDLRLYFQDKQRIWNYFEARITSESPARLCTSYPESLFQLQRRKHKRMKAPEGTAAFFYNNETFQYGGLVKNLSLSGMLVCTRDLEWQFKEAPELYEISISLPSHPLSARIVVGNKTPSSLVAGYGKVVRSFRDSKTKCSYHGISFDDSDIKMRDELDIYLRSISSET